MSAGAIENENECVYSPHLIQSLRHENDADIVCIAAATAHDQIPPETRVLKRKRSSTSPECTNDVTVKKPHLSYLSEHTILLVVGEMKAEFYVHAHMLSRVSTFFKAALDSGFKKGGERIVTLPEDAVETVDCFVQWVYHPKFTIVEAVDTEAANERKRLATRHFKIYIFAEKYDIPELKRYAIISLFKIVRKSRAPGQPIIKKWYEQKPAKCGLRRLLCDWYLWKTSSNYLASEKCRDTLIQNPEFSADLVGALCQLSPRGNVRSRRTWKLKNIFEALL